MQISHLKSLYNHVGLPFSTDEVSLQMLRRTILLELKGQGDQPLTIDGILWSKNDIIQFFEVKPDQLFDLEQFLVAFPDAKVLYQLSDLNYRNHLRQLDAESEMIGAFRENESSSLESSFSRYVKEEFRKENDYYVSAALLYLVFFKPAFQLETLKWVKDQLIYRMDNLLINIPVSKQDQLITESKFLRMKGYYALIKDHFNYDTVVLEKNSDCVNALTNKIPHTSLLVIVKLQLELAHSSSIIRFLEGLRDQLSGIVKKEVQNQSGDGPSAGRIIGIIVGILIAVFRIATTCNRHSSPSYDFESNRVPVIDYDSYPNMDESGTNDTISDSTSLSRDSIIKELMKEEIKRQEEMNKLYE